MGRPPAFDRDGVLDSALATFWARGYAATSIDDLVAAMGIGRQSLYNAFGDKRALYLAALDRYVATDAGRFLEPLRDPDVAPLAALQTSFARLLAECDAPAGDRGCFVVNAATECAAADPVVAAATRRAARGGEELIHEALLRARARGEIPPERDPRALARALGLVIVGLRVNARMGGDAGGRAEAATAALEALTR